jgi:hypothetical protein
MGTGAVAFLFHSFPYGGPDHPALRALFMAFYMLNVVRAPCLLHSFRTRFG